ncbi:MAG: hypothetical protein R3E73_07240 [Porticoccaceae bacterium]
MKTNHRLLLKHGLSGTCLGLLLLIGSGSNAEDLGIKNLASTIDSWRISSKLTDPDGLHKSASALPALFVPARYGAISHNERSLQTIDLSG